MDIPEFFPMTFDREMIEEILDERDRLTFLLSRLSMLKHPNFGLKEREPIDRAINAALDGNLKRLKEVSGRLKAGE